MAKWTMDLNKYVQKKIAEVKETRKAYAFALYSSIVRKTPVDTGRARGNWNISVGHDVTTTSEKKEQQFRSLSQLPDLKDDQTIYISNNLDYICRLEHGYSKQAPNGMVGLTLANSKNIFDAAVRSVKK